MNQMEEKKVELKSTIEEAEEMILEMNRFSDYLVNQINFNNKKTKKEINMNTDTDNIGNNDEVNTTDVKVTDREKVSENTEYKAEVRAEYESENKIKTKADVKTENSGIGKTEHYVDFKVTDIINKEEEKERFEPANKADLTYKTSNTVRFKEVKDIEGNSSNFDAVRIDLNNENFQENNVYTIKDIIKNAKKNTAQNATENSAQNAMTLSFKHREVLKLATEGLSDTEIAKRMNIGKGEVQLILGLNR